MDPISAISLAAAAAQFIELAIKVVRRMSDFSADLDQAPKAFRQIKTKLPLIVDGLRRMGDGDCGASMDPNSRSDLYRVVEECQEVVTQLDKLLDKVLPLSGASSWVRRYKAVASLTYDREAKELEKSLGEYIQVLIFHQVVPPTTQTGSAAGSKSGSWWLVPFDRNSSFVGRDEIFKAIDETLGVEEGAQPKAALWGLGGIGKSQIALEHCHRARQNDNKLAVFWVNAATVFRFEESYKRIAVECGLVQKDESNSGDAAFLLQDWLQSTHTGPWLMVIDNVDDKDAFFYDKLSNASTPSQCIPRCAHGSLLFTTRTRDIAVDLATPTEPIEIPHMKREEGMQLVKGRLHRTPGPLDDATVDELLNELEYIPLAITQAMAFISKRRKTIQQYLEQYRKNDATRTRMLTFEFAEHGRQIGSLESVAKTWSVTFDWIRCNNPRASDLLCLASFFQYQAIPRRLLILPKAEARNQATTDGEDGEDDEDSFEFEDALETLRAFSLLDAGGSADVFATHHLVQLATQWWLQSEGLEKKEIWALEALRSVARHFPIWDSMPTGYWSLCESLFPHAELLLAYEFDSRRLPDQQRTIDLARANLLVTTGHYLAWMDTYEEALTRLKESVTLRTRHLGERNVDTLVSMGQVAWFHSLMIRDPSQAVPLGRRVLALRSDLLGADHEHTIDSMCDLAGALGDNGEHAESEALQREAIERGIRTVGPHSLLVTNCTALLAEVLQKQRNYTEAAKIRRLVYRKRHDLYGPEDISVLVAETQLAWTLICMGETREEGMSLMRQTLATKQRVLGIDHRETLVSTWNLVLALHGSAKLQEALATCNAAVTACDHGPRKDNPQSAEIVQMLRTQAEIIREKITHVELVETASG